MDARGLFDMNFITAWGLNGIMETLCLCTKPKVSIKVNIHLNFICLSFVICRLTIILKVNKNSSYIFNFWKAFFWYKLTCIMAFVAFCKSMKNWNTNLTSCREDLANINIRRDRLSPLLFVICMIPLTHI